MFYVGNAVLGVPFRRKAENRCELRTNLPIEVKFVRRNAGDGVPYRDDTLKTGNRQASLSMAANNAASSFLVKGCSRRPDKAVWADARDERMSRSTARWSGNKMGVPVSR